MAKLILTTADAANPVPIPAGLNLEVIGTSAVETFDVAAGAQANINGGGGVDVIRIAGAQADYTVKTVGTSAVLTHTASGKTVTIPLNTSGDKISFAGGTAVDLKIDTTGGTPKFVLGTQTLTTTDAPVTGAGPSNAAPVAGDDTATTTLGTAVTIDVLANDTDADGDTLTISAKTDGTKGTAAIADGKITYTPNAGATAGTDTFTYTVSDGKGGTDTANVTVTLTEVPPVTYTLTSAGSVVEGSKLTFTLKASTAPTADTTFNVAVIGDTLGSTAAAASASDFSSPTTVTLKAGQTIATFDVTAVTDALVEGVEGAKATVLNGATPVVSTTFLINDLPADTTPPVVTTGQTVSYGDNIKDTTTALGKVTATDDVGVTGFTISTGDANGYFAIDATGQLTLTTKGSTAGATSMVAGTSFTLGIIASDAAKNSSTATNVTLTVTDKTSPTLATTNPAVISGTTLSLNFSETLSTSKLPVATDFVVTSTVSGSSTAVTINGVTISGSTVTLALASAPASGSTVSVSYTPNADTTKVLQDATGNKVAAISSQTALVDATAPTLLSSVPTDGATSVAVGSDIVLTMSETVKAGTGNIVITNNNDSTDTRTIDVTSSQVTFSGSTVTINPTADLKTGGSYVVTIASGVIKDIAGNSFAGISGTALDFTTPGGSTTGQTFTLTTATDSIPGLKGSLGTTDNSGNDTIVGEFATSPANTLNASDQVNGGTGTDIFKLYGTYSAAQMPVNITGVETLNFAALAAADLDLSTYTKAATGVTSVVVDDANLMSANKITTSTGQSLTIGTGTTGLALAATGNIWAASPADTTLNLTLSGFQGGTGVTPWDFEVTGAVATTVNLTSTGALFNRVTTLTLPATTTGVVISGDKSLAVTTDFLAKGVPTGIKSIDASTSTGGVSIKTAATTNTAFKFTGGSGNDAIWFADNNLGTIISGSQLDGGSGSADKLGLLDTAISVTEYTAINAAKNFEVLGLAAAAAGVDGSQLTSIKTFSLDANATQSITSMKTGSAVNITAAHAANVTLNGAVGVNDVAVNIGVSTATAEVAATAGITVGGVLSIAQPTVTMTSNGTNAAANTITTLTLADSASVTVSGSNALTIGTLTAATSTGHKIDGSAMTGKLTAAVDPSKAYSAGSSLGDILIGGSAADSLTAGKNSSTLTGNGGADTFDVNVAVTGGTSSANITTITDFTKGDKIVFGATAAAFTAAKVDLSSATTEQAAIDLLVAGSNTDLKWGVYNGNTYVADDVGTTAVMAATDTVVKLSGVLDLTTSTFASATLTFA